MLRYRSALPNGMLHSPHASRFLMLYLILHTYIYFTLFNVDYELLTKLRLFTLFELPLFYLFYIHFQ
ncbi:MAG: hypothetical protein NZ455_15915 [Bacteroidia bacterium]|nr:hypothetical protein [Bacteroidia bacterium]MDW8348062.1 hypothetical protein [Bacteroidia bacterium]